MSLSQPYDKGDELTRETRDALDQFLAEPAEARRGPRAWPGAPSRCSATVPPAKTSRVGAAQAMTIWRTSTG